MITKETATELYKAWQGGRSKSAIEREEFGDSKSHGKKITAIWREFGWETEREHPLVIENRRLINRNNRLIRLLEDHGVEGF